MQLKNLHKDGKIDIGLASIRGNYSPSADEKAKKLNKQENKLLFYIIKIHFGTLAAIFSVNNIKLIEESIKWHKLLIPI